ncbi:sterol desaturase family protein [Alkalimarinus coralli]|uniref:sterol desaturase family protein n=1 Tax=Alkalimarinus coralli TaxID=2935863 RepID=UPI00202BA361|nr:sterol desaturase family protein [Alkalimarinus coralli]
MDVLLTVVLVGVMMLLVERLMPGTRLPKVKNWWPRVVIFNAIQASSVFVAAATWDAWLPEYRLFDNQTLNPWLGALYGYLTITFVYYWWHRARHEFPLLWRWFHQLHHSPQRLEVVTSFYKHPIEIFTNSLLSSVVLYFICGLSPGAVSLAVLFMGGAEFFYHWNIRTPRWVGFIIQRPESHRAHHEYGAHTRNFSDLPLWDLLFGTFYNPEAVPEKCGFNAESEQRVWLMLAGKQVAQVQQNNRYKGETQ